MQKELMLYEINSNLILLVIMRKKVRWSNDFTVELHLFGRWLSESPIIRLDLALPVNIFLPQLYYIFLWFQFFHPYIKHT